MSTSLSSIPAAIRDRISAPAQPRGKCHAGRRPIRKTAESDVNAVLCGLHINELEIS